VPNSYSKIFMLARQGYF